MPVLLIGVGADGDNMDPVPHITDEGKFDFIPMPEKRGPDETSEERTFENYDAQFGGDQLTATNHYIKSINPGGENDDEIKERTDLKTHPVHHDPNFEYLTFGEGGRHRNKIKNFDPADQEEDCILAFYTGLRTVVDPGDNYGERLVKRRYIIGYFTVAQQEIVKETNQEGWTTERQKSVLEQFPNNAHYKRFLGAGELYSGSGTDDMDYVALFKGKQEKAAGLLDRGYPISTYTKGACQKCDREQGHYHLTSEFIDAFEIPDDEKEKSLSRKPVLSPQLTPGEFREKLSDPNHHPFL